MNKDGKIIHSYGDFEDVHQVNAKIRNIAHTVYGNLKLYLLNKIVKKEIPCANRQKIFEEKKGNVDYITGADLFIKNNELAYYDERYFMYCEEMDLQYSMAQNGLSRILITSPKIIHLEGASAKKENNIILQEATFSRINWRISQIYFFRKHGTLISKIFIWKFFVLLLWLNPLIFKQTWKYIRSLWKI